MMPVWFRMLQRLQMVHVDVFLESSTQGVPHHNLEPLKNCTVANIASLYSLSELCNNHGHDN